MSGVVAGLVASVKSAPSGPVNLVLNPSFTADSIDGWSGSGNVGLARQTALFRTAPAGLQFFGIEDLPNVSYYRGEVLTVGQSYSLSLYLQALGEQSYTIKFYAGDTITTLTTPTKTANTWHNFKIENVSCVGNTSFIVEINSDYDTYVDDVSVVQGATALVL